MPKTEVGTEEIEDGSILDKDINRLTDRSLSDDFYEEPTNNPDGTVNKITVWENDAKVKKIEDSTFSYTNGFLTKEVRKVYMTNGTDVKWTETIAFNYDDNGLYLNSSVVIT